MRTSAYLVAVLLIVVGVALDKMQQIEILYGKYANYAALVKQRETECNILLMGPLVLVKAPRQLDLLKNMVFPNFNR